MTINQIGRSPCFVPKQAATHARTIVTLAAIAAVTFTLGASPSRAQMGSDRGNGNQSQQDTRDRNHQRSGDSSRQDQGGRGDGHGQTSRDHSDYGNGGDNWQGNSDHGRARYHRTDSYNGMSYYHGHRHNRKYYTYNGHRYVLDLGSGIRILID